MYIVLLNNMNIIYLFIYLYIYNAYVTLDHKTSHKGQLFEIHNLKADN